MSMVSIDEKLTRSPLGQGTLRKVTPLTKPSDGYAI